MLFDRALIVGIDPGTKTGIASLDLSGNFVFIKSEKTFSKSKIVKLVLSFGNPIILASDIAVTPRTIEKLASTFSAKMIKPKKSITRREKNNIINSLRWRDLKNLCGNRHERDALVAAIHAYTRVENLIRRVDKRLKKHDLSKSVKEQIRSNVILFEESIDKSIKKVVNNS